MVRLGWIIFASHSLVQLRTELCFLDTWHWCDIETKLQFELRFPQSRCKTLFSTPKYFQSIVKWVCLLKMHSLNWPCPSAHSIATLIRGSVAKWFMKKMIQLSLQVLPSSPQSMTTADGKVAARVAPKRCHFYYFYGPKNVLVFEKFM